MIRDRERMIKKKEWKRRIKRLFFPFLLISSDIKNSLSLTDLFFFLLQFSYWVSLFVIFLSYSVVSNGVKIHKARPDTQFDKDVDWELATREMER